MAGLKTIYNLQGLPITDFKSTAVWSSLLNDVGEAVFYIATNGIKCKRNYLEFGNYVVLQHDKLPDWVGIIDTPRIWHSGYVEVHAFELPFLLKYRLLPLGLTVNATPGDKFKSLIDHANSSFDTLLRIGDVSSGGSVVSETFTLDVFSHIKNLATDNNYEWVCSPQFDGVGRLTVKIDFSKRTNIPTGLVLQQGKNMQYGDTPLEESGELINSIEAMLEGAQTASVFSENAAYGLRQIRKTFNGVTDSSGLENNARELLRERKSPDMSTPLVAVDVGETFSKIALRNIVSYSYTNVGFSGDVLGMAQDLRIEGYRFDQSLGTCEIFAGKT